MRILGIDPSLNKTGYGVVDFSAGTVRLVEGGVITPPRSKNLGLRLADLQRSLAEIIGTLRPDVMVVEDVFSQAIRPRTAILMGHARGALICAAALADMPIYHYSATAVKRALVGTGAASKQQVASMVVQTLRLRHRFEHDDESDALALAIAHGRRAASDANVASRIHSRASNGRRKR